MTVRQRHTYSNNISPPLLVFSSPPPPLHSWLWHMGHRGGDRAAVCPSQPLWDTAPSSLPQAGHFPGLQPLRSSCSPWGSPWQHLLGISGTPRTLQSCSRMPMWRVRDHAVNFLSPQMPLLSCECVFPSVKSPSGHTNATGCRERIPDTLP